MNHSDIKIYCNNCQHDTWHSILFYKKDTWADEHHPIDGGDDYKIAQCNGCKGVSYEERSWFSEDVNTDGTLDITVKRFPPKTLRKKPKWFSRLHVVHILSGSGFGMLFNETYIALQNNCRSLAVMGIRALLEQIMIEKCGDQGSFTANINKFENDGYISKLQKNALLPVIEAGHAAVHRSYEPKSEEVISALDITENIIESIYVNESKGNKLNETVPKKNNT